MFLNVVYKSLKIDTSLKRLKVSFFVSAYFLVICIFMCACMVLEIENRPKCIVFMFSYPHSNTVNHDNSGVVCGVSKVANQISSNL